MSIPPLREKLNTSFPHICFIEFRVTSKERFQVLAHVFDLLKQEKSRRLVAIKKNESESREEQEQVLQKLVNVLFDLLDERVLANFWWPSKQEVEDYVRQWKATPIPQRFDAQSSKSPWDFESMIDCFMNGEYELIACRLLNSSIAVFEFFPFSYPYGGTGCMKALIEAFEFKIVGQDDGTGYTSFL